MYISHYSGPGIVIQFTLLIFYRVFYYFMNLHILLIFCVFFKKRFKTFLLFLTWQKGHPDGELNLVKLFSTWRIFFRFWREEYKYQNVNVSYMCVWKKQITFLKSPRWSETKSFSLRLDPLIPVELLQDVFSLHLRTIIPAVSSVLRCIWLHSCDYKLQYFSITFVSDISTAFFVIVCVMVFNDNCNF